MKKMSLHDALSRVGNPRLRRGGAKLSASARDLIDAGLDRVANKGKKKAKRKTTAKGKTRKVAKKKPAKKSTKVTAKKRKSGKSRKASRKALAARARAAGAGSPEMAAYMASIRGKKGKGKAKKKRSKRAANPSARVRHAHASARDANGRKKRRRSVKRHRAHARRRHNPGFDVKATLIQTGLIVAGAFIAARLAPLVGDGLSKIGFLKDNPKFVGYAHLAAGALVAVAGDYLQERFGGKIGFDVRPAAIAAGAVLAYDGLKRADLVPASGTFALTGPAAGTFALTGPSPAMNGALVLPNLNDPNAMLGTHDYMHGLGYEDYGMGATVLANLPETNAMLGSIFDDGDPMNGTIFTAAELPVPVVAPHSVMQGNQVTVPQMC